MSLTRSQLVKKEMRAIGTDRADARVLAETIVKHQEEIDRSCGVIRPHAYYDYSWVTSFQDDDYEWAMNTPLPDENVIVAQ